MGSRAMLPQGPVTLTQHEAAALSFMARGATVKVIARALDLSPRSVERNLERCRRKLRARNAPHLVARAIAAGHLPS